MLITDEDREWIDTRADQLFRESERRRGGIRPNTVMPQDFRDYFVVQAAWERAERRGAERMRERATQAAEPKRKPKKKNGGLHRGAYTDPQAAGAYSARQSIAKAIRALPLTEETPDDDA